MKLFKRSVETKNYKRSIKRFIQLKVRPITLSIKHFYKSSIIFFKQHPRIRNAAAVVGIFLLIIVVSHVFETFAKRGINQNFMNGEVSEVETPFWYKLFMEDDPSYNQKVELDYISWDGTVPTWDATNLDANFDGGDGSEANPYIIASPRALLNFRSAENYTTFNKNNRRYYLVTENIDLGGINIGSASDELFSGVIDGNYKHIKGLKIDTDESGRGDISLLGRIGDGDKPVVKNFIIDDVEINTSGTANYYVGALVSYVGSKAVVYNSGVLSGTITIGEMNTSKKNYIGSLVGFIADKNNNNAVANCYSYVNINSDNTLGNNTKIGGVVGYRDRDSENMNDRNSVVFDLVYYGTITMSDKNNNYRFAYNAPRNISTSQSPTYTYYMWSGDTKDMPTNPAIETYSIAKNSDDFVSEGFLAHLNNYRYMSYYYLGYDEHPRDSQATGYQDIGEWYIDVTVSPYPILRRHQNESSTRSTETDGTLRVKFGTATYSSSVVVTGRTCVQQGYWGCNRWEYNYENRQTENFNGTTRNLPIYKMDPEENDFTNRKIILPYNSEMGLTKANQNGYKMTLVGWRLKSGKDANGVFTYESTDAANLSYNYAIRNGFGSISKDIGLVFAEGGYYLVPDDVVEVTFEPVWAYTIYVGDAFNDEMFNTLNGNSNYTLADWNSYWNNGLTGNDDNNNGRTPQTAVATLQKAYELAAQTPKHDDLYSTVIVLVDNLHYSPSQDSPTDLNCDYVVNNNNVQVTIKSLDEDGDNKPDYSLYMRNLHNMNIPSVRFDFVNLLGIPQVGITNGKLNQFHMINDSDFEVTETAKTDLIDLNIANAKSTRVNGGFYNIFAGVSGQAIKTKYIIFGGKAYANLLTAGWIEKSGSGWNNTTATINVLGGRVKELSATYAQGSTISINVYLNVDGGYIDTFHSVYGSGSRRTVYVNVNGSYVNSLYAGGALETSDIEGGVVTNVDNSRIGKFFGGPEFGSIESGTKSTINNSVLNKVYGAGDGGTIYFPDNNSIRKNETCSSTNYTEGTGAFSGNSYSSLYISDTVGNKHFLSAYFTSELISKNGCAISYATTYFATLSAASVDKVELYINDSTVKGDVYGGGNKGKVSGDVILVLNNTSVGGSVYGGGYSSEIETVNVMPSTSGFVGPQFISYAIDNKGIYPQFRTMIWTNYTGSSQDFYSVYQSAVNYDEGTILSPYYKGFGEVQSENVYVELKGSGTVVDGNVFGGGNLASVNLNDGAGTLNLLINDGVTIRGSVFGGGNNANVNGNTDVRIVNKETAQTKINTVYAASNNGSVSGKAEVTINGHPKITNLFGGGNNASVDNTNIYIEGGDITNVYGGSNTNGEVDTSNIHIGELNPVGTLGTFDEPYVDICQTGGIGFDLVISSENGNQNNVTIYLYNNTRNVTFTKYTFKLKAYIFGSFNHVWDSTYPGNISVVDHTIVINDVNRYNPQESIELEPGRVLYYKFGVNLDAGMETYDNQYHDYYWTYKTQQVIAYDEAGHEYILNGCKPQIRDRYGRVISSGYNYSSLEQNGRVQQEVTIPASSFDLPRIDETLDNITLGNIFGGNNVGGRTDTVNIMVNGKNSGSNVEIGNIYGGGSKTSTGTTKDTKARIAVYGGHVTGSVFGSSFGDIEDTTMATPATMYSTPYVLITGGATIDGSVFGGGYAKDANVGDANVDTSTYVYIDSATIGENVYGGGYGDVIYGSSHVYVGLTNDMSTQVRNIFEISNNNSPFKNVTIAGNNSRATVAIHGTVFGGSETGSKDAESYDYKTFSVEKGIDIYVTDVNNKVTVTIDKSIFGSGNYSSSRGTSYIYLTNFGTRTNPKRMASIQRANNVIISNSSILLSGATDSTNKFDKVKYSFNNITNLKLGNSSTVYTSAQANMLQNYYSYQGNCQNTNSSGQTTNGTLQTVTKNGNTITVDDDTKQVVSSTSGGNRIYLLNGKGLNILTAEEIGEGFGNVYGMTFVGVYEDNNGTISRSYFDSNYDFNARGTNVPVNNTEFSGYVLGGNRVVNGEVQDYTVHGFYTNTYYPQGNTRRVYSTIINPTPERQEYYYWNIGSPSIAMEVNLTASKYNLSGMKSIAMYQFSDAQKVSFDITDFEASSLNGNVSLIDSSSIPTIASTSDIAESVFGLSIETSESGWVNEGYTGFRKTANSSGSESIEGTVKYDSSGSEKIPKFVINFENSRNIKHDIDLGTVVITLKAHAFMDNLVESTTTTIKIYVNLDTAYYDTDDYESAMAPGKFYKSFLSTKTNITPNSTFSTFFNMYATGNNVYQKAQETYPGAVIDHVLYTSYELPAGTRITMLDISNNRDPKYYYYDVTGTEGDALKPMTDNKYNGDTDTFYSYPLSWFRQMDSTSAGNLYNEDENRSRYLIDDLDFDGNAATSTVESFIFMVDFRDVTNHTSALPITNEEFYLALRATDGDNQYVFSTPISETMDKMNFNLFDATDASFDLEVSDYPTEADNIYVDDIFDFNAKVDVNEKPIYDETYGNLSVRNTSYFQDRLGLRIGLYLITEDSNGNEIATQVVGDELSGAVFYIGDVGYAPATNGLIRLKLADYVVKVDKTITVDLSNSNIRSGLYEFRITAFASSDGLFAKQGDTITNSTDSFRVNLVNEKYGLNTTISEDSDTIIYKNGKTTGGEDTVDIDLNYFGSYTNPTIKVSLMRRKYTDINSYEYEDVNINSLFDLNNTTFSDLNNLTATDLLDTSTMTIKKEALTGHTDSANMGSYHMTFKLRNDADLKTGTYRIMFTLYNGTHEVGDVYTYVIVKN